MKKYTLLLISIMLLICRSYLTFGHCDTMDGPLIRDARTALAQNNVNYVLKWVRPEDEKGITNTFISIMKVRDLGPEAKDLAEHYFFETLVRVHRNGEGVPYTGIKPSGTPIEERILAADKSIERGELSPLEKFVPKDIFPGLKERFEKVMLLKNFDVNNVAAGREYIEAYVQFFHFAEGEEAESHHPHGGAGNPGNMPWILSGVFFITSLVLGIMLYRKK